MSKKRFDIRMDSEILSKIEQKKEITGMTKTEIVETALNVYFDGSDNDYVKVNEKQEFKAKICNILHENDTLIETEGDKKILREVGRRVWDI